MKIKHLDKVVPEPVLEAAWVEPADSLKQKVLNGLRGSGFVAGAVTLPDNAALAAVADGLWVVPLKPGLLAPVALEGGFKVPRSEIRSFTIGKAAVNLPVDIRTESDGDLRFIVHRSRRKHLEPVIAALGLA